MEKIKFGTLIIEISVDRPKLANFLLDVLQGINKTNKAEQARSLSSLALITEYAIHLYVEKKNHVAVIEAWTIYLAAIVSFATKHKIPEKNWKSDFHLALESIDQAFLGLIEVIKERRHFVEGNPMVD